MNASRRYRGGGRAQLTLLSVLSASSNPPVATELPAARPREPLCGDPHSPSVDMHDMFPTQSAHTHTDTHAYAYKTAPGKNKGGGSARAACPQTHLVDLSVGAIADYLHELEYPCRILQRAKQTYTLAISHQDNQHMMHFRLFVFLGVVSGQPQCYCQPSPAHAYAFSFPNKGTVGTADSEPIYQ